MIDDDMARNDLKEENPNDGNNVLAAALLHKSK
jgi:hypothetical protein